MRIQYLFNQLYPDNWIYQLKSLNKEGGEIDFHFFTKCKDGGLWFSRPELIICVWKVKFKTK